MSKPVKYAIAIIVCLLLWAVCIALMTVIGVGGFIPMFILFLSMKYIWRAIVNYDPLKENASEDEVSKENR